MTRRSKEWGCSIAGYFGVTHPEESLNGSPPKFPETPTRTVS
eukprot:CAMPEP_0174367512 /NCGR_PEP_ID=MMETSP0811_2-20130205/85626_1 /TAXON_ID=73025 ORGANISM="Eutreptiella gymnastica-like, Strain CCMP1594" /NCGR_SAMPLE_ID=MMETSP0811_2 /ASSEMBLY_ACC=CAM_ASM_000667 /LENGTH=41 /DNA_ID= /DNA_START= /DNA_END= /DNA_ORIENTATION=